MSSRVQLLISNGGDPCDLDSAHRVLRRWAQARLGQGDDFWDDAYLDGVARAAIDVMAVTHTLLLQLERGGEFNDIALERIEALEAEAEKAAIGEEHY